jgi:two-component system cell cycle response regulator
MGARIIVVDDNAVNLKLVRDLLELEGHVVIAFEDAASALAELGRGPTPDLILTDIAMPGMDGLEFTRRLRAMPPYDSVPIVALTAFAMKGDEERVLTAGCSGYIAKPIDTRRLPTQVARFLGRGESPKGDGLKVMIVEDHRIDMKLAGENARLSGHVVLNSTSAEEALSDLDRNHPDVVLLDLNLPGMDGLSFVRRIKADPKTSHLPVVAVTAYPDKYREQEMLGAGCAAYLMKPIDMPLLMEALKRASGR